MHSIAPTIVVHRPTPRTINLNAHRKRDFDVIDELAHRTADRFIVAGESNSAHEHG